MPIPEVSPWPEDGLEQVPACPACGSDRRALLYRDLVDTNFRRTAPGRWTSWTCRSCRSAYLDPRPTPATIALAYEAYYTHGDPAPAPVGRLAALVLANESPAPGRQDLLDIGAGAGGWVSQATDAGWRARGLEPDKRASSVARARGADVEVGGVDAIGAHRADVITMNHVIEHLHDPIASLGRCHGALRPGGTLWIATPNVRSLGHRAFGSPWYGLDPPRHLVVFSRAGLEMALRAAGFERLAWRPGVGAREAARRVRGAVGARRAASGPPPSPGAEFHPGSRRERLAANRGVSAALRAVELVLPGTADELLVRAFAD